ncbi:universal stress protein [Sinomicrobium pectinilyticum]|uniref:Universal stress protein n=1 Tax=Sinomicrobium pectinilyticum TaxID=1084421 RepID=A0A3N0EC11_SINP1|nr:universal stress protein [Sinomicrobium pectinilyticum]RNL85380.1 universal stress protein [Sinomicrobium pectinilyticum]
MKTILIPTDFSANAHKAMEYAVYLFEKQACTFYLLNAQETNLTGLNAGRTGSLNEKMMEDLFKEINMENTNPKHFYEREIIYDSLVNAIGKTVLSKNVDYIFMGTKGSTAAKEIFMGSNALKVIKNMDFCPVVAVPKAYDYDLPDEILFPTDFKNTYEEFGLKPLKEIARLWGAKIRILYIAEEESLNETQIKNSKKLERILKNLNHTREEIVKYDNTFKVITRYSENKSIGMVAMINNKHSFLEKLFREPVIRNTVFKIKVPFLVMPDIT